MLRHLYRRSSLAAMSAAATSAVAYATACEPKSPAPVSTGVATESILLKDGRRLAFRTEGDADGVAVYALHGMGSSSLTWTTRPSKPLSTLVSGVKLIAVDRPGYGDSSDPPAGYSYSQFAADLAQLADALGTPTFCVAGHSSGGPYALATAAVLRERVLACAAIGSDPPYVHPRVPAELRQHDMAYEIGGADGFFGVDPVVKFEKWRQSSLASGVPAKVHAWKGGAIGFVFDFNLERLPWSFKLEDISLGRKLTFWVGEKDYDSMKIGAPWMQSMVPGSIVEVVPGGDHGFKSKPEHLKAILERLRDQAMSS